MILTRRDFIRVSSVSGLGIVLSNNLPKGLAGTAAPLSSNPPMPAPIPPGIPTPSRPLHEVDLSGVWDFRPEGGSWKSIRVPGGGWLKQGFNCEAALYQRRIQVPHGPPGQVVRLELGAVNHITGCFLGRDQASLKKIGSDVTAFTPQVFDLTPHVRPGGDFLLRLAIRAYQNGRPVAPHWAEWCECIARGLFRSAHLRTYPDVFIDTLPGFLPPSAKNPGWPAAVSNFLRLNYNVQRQHMGPWTPYMIDVCDELGLMLIGESSTRWDGFDMENGRGFHEVKCLQELVRRDKNHPSIIRWSSKNEAQCTDPAYHLELYEAIKAVDQTRPISEDICYGDPNAFDVKRVFKLLWDKPDFTWIDHYFTCNSQGRPTFQTIGHNDAVIPMSERPYGLGEADWVRSTTPAGLSWFATTTVLARLQGASDVRPYVLLSSWVSSIPGVKTSDFVTEENRHPVYGEDNLPDPWSHPGIRLLQAACHPLLAADGEFWKANRKCDAFGHFPVIAPVLPAKSRASRAITVFNDEFAGENLELAWELREGSPSNWVWDHGSIPPGRA